MLNQENNTHIDKYSNKETKILSRAESLQKRVGQRVGVGTQNNNTFIRSTVQLVLWLLAFVMSLTMLCCLSANKGDINRVDAVSPTAISTVAELKAVANNLSGSYYLANDITVTDSTWTPIGTSSSSAFTGIFDGNGHSITFTQTIHITSESGDACGGVFGYAGEATIENLGVNWAGTEEVSIMVGSETKSYTGLVVSSTSSASYAGGIAGLVSADIDPITINNCYNTGAVSAISTSNYACAGGIVGRFEPGPFGFPLIVNNCYNTGAVSAASISRYAYAGGIAGWFDSDGDDLSTISNCYNTGVISSSDCAGGIAGYGSAITISNCYNAGAVSVTSTDSSSDCAGGIAGYGSAITISNCYNTGVISSSDCAGGIAGDCSETIISNCYNTGAVKATTSASSKTADAGGIVGMGHSSIISNCFSIGTVPSVNDIPFGGIAGYLRRELESCYHNYEIIGSGVYEGTYKGTLAEDVKNIETFTTNNTLTWNSSYPWNFTSVWGINANASNVYPILRDLSNVTVTYQIDKNDSSQNQTQIYNFAESPNITLKDNTTFTKEGYHFTQWTDGTNYYNCGSTQLFEKNIILYPVWEVNVYNLTFNQDGGQGGATNITITHGSTLVSSVAVPTKTGYTFLGYYLGDTQFYNNQGVLVNTGYVVSGPLSLTAKWQVNTYNLTFNQDGGQNGASATTITYGQKLPNSVSVPTKDKYTFSGYYLNDTQFYNASGELVNTSYTVTGALELTAKWVSNYTAVTFNITTNVGVIFNVYDSDNNFVQQIYVAKGSGEQTISTQLLKGEVYTVRISAFSTANITLDTDNSMAGISMSGRTLTFEVSDSGNTITMQITGFSWGNGIVV